MLLLFSPGRGEPFRRAVAASLGFSIPAYAIANNVRYVMLHVCVGNTTT